MLTICRYQHLDMADLERKLQEASSARVKLIATDGAPERQECQSLVAHVFWVPVGGSCTLLPCIIRVGRERLLLARCMGAPSVAPVRFDAGVFSMDGHIAPLPDICALARKYGALVFVVRARVAARHMGSPRTGCKQAWLHGTWSVRMLKKIPPSCGEQGCMLTMPLSSCIARKYVVQPCDVLQLQRSCSPQ